MSAVVALTALFGASLCASGLAGKNQIMTPPPDDRLLRRGLTLEYATLGWNVAGVGVLAWSAIAARSVALAGFGLDSLIEIGASVVVVWELTGTGAGDSTGPYG